MSFVSRCEGVMQSVLNFFPGPTVGIELNGGNVILSSVDVRSSLSIAESEMHISNSKESAKSEIDAFYNFIDMSMS